MTQGPDMHPNGCYGPAGRFVVMQAALQDGKPVSRIALTPAAAEYG